MTFQNRQGLQVDREVGLAVAVAIDDRFIAFTFSGDDVAAGGGGLDRVYFGDKT